MEVVVGLQLEDGVDEAEGLVGGVVSVQLGDDLQCWSSVELLAVGGDVRPSGLVYNPGHGLEQTSSNPSCQGLNREHRDASELIRQLTISFEPLVGGDKVLPECHTLFRVLEARFDSVTDSL